MPTFEVTIEQKTYHVDIPWLGSRPLEVIVDGQPLQICMSPAQEAARLQVRQVIDAEGLQNAAMVNKPVMAEWHASIRAE